MDHPYEVDPRESNGHATDDVTPKGQGREPIIFEAPYLHNGAR